ncbi:MAG: hypothetical protein RI891_1383 [Gemmatimonadota bacterium]
MSWRRAVSLVAVAAAVAACGGSKDPKTAPTPEELNAAALGVPVWFVKPPVDSNILYAPVSAVSRDMQLAIDKAQSNGRFALAQQLETRFEGMSKRFQEETGAGADAQILEQFSVAYKGIVMQTVNGSRMTKQEIRNEGTQFRVYALMELPSGPAAVALQQRIRSNEQLLTRMRATQAYAELDAQVKRYQETQKEP